MSDSPDYPKPSAKDVGETRIDPTLQGLRLIADVSTQEGAAIRTICYPGCGSDGTPSIAIPEAITTYIDPSEDTTKGLVNTQAMCKRSSFYPKK